MKKIEHKMKTKKTIIAILASIPMISAWASNPSGELYKNFIVDDIKYFGSDIFNNLMNIDEFKKEKDLRGMADIIDYCYELSEEEMKYCYITLSKAGQHEAFYGLAEHHFKSFELFEGKDKKAQSLIFSAMLLGMGDGFKGLELMHEAPYRSFRITYNDFKESDKITPENKEILHNFYLKGVLDSQQYPLNNLYYEYDENVFNVEEMGIDVEISDELKQLVDEKLYADIFMPIREQLKSTTSVNFLMREIANKRYAKIFQAFITGENEFPKNSKLGFYGLHNLSFIQKDKLGSELLLTELYRKIKLPEDGIDSVKINNAFIKAAANLYSYHPETEIGVWELFLDDKMSNEEELIKTIQLFNKYRKELTL